MKKIKWRLGQRITWLESDMRGTVVEVIPADTNDGPWVRVEPDHPGGDFRSSGWEDERTIRPLNAVELLSEVE